jgi:hypothetical protein
MRRKKVFAGGFIGLLGLIRLYFRLPGGQRGFIRL